MTSLHTKPAGASVTSRAYSIGPMRNILCVDWNSSLPVAASRVVTRITAVERPLCKGSVVTVDLAARHRFEKIDARGIAHVVHAKRIRREPAADFSNEIARAAMDTAAIIAQAFGNVHREIHIPRLAHLDYLNILSELGRLRNVCTTSSRSVSRQPFRFPFRIQKILFAPTTSAAFIGVIFVQPSHCINKQLPFSVERSRAQASQPSSAYALRTK